MCSQNININPNVFKLPNVLSTNDEQEKKMAEQNQKFNEDIVAKIHLLLNGLPHRKAKYMLELAIANLSDKSILHI